MSDLNNNNTHDDQFKFNSSDEEVSSSQESQHSIHYDPNSDDEESSDIKVFNDSIHGHIEMHPLLVKFIDTPQFQRLRSIKQLGGNYFVYPGASHNRFEHCIGTCHLADKLLRHLKSKQPSLGITERDVLCVQIAALCHDLGHGPYSHMFDGEFLPEVRNGSWHHEEGSCMMLDYLIDDNHLHRDMEEYGLVPTIDVVFIKEMINGPLSHRRDTKGWKYEGRLRDKSFLYEIVSNDRNKVDVDKWDYFVRDCHHLGVRNSFDHNRFMLNMKVLKLQGTRQLCARDKEASQLYEMFHLRNKLHRLAYQHKVSSAVESMICDAMLLANDHVKLVGSGGELVRMSEAVDDPVAYLKLTDQIFYLILYSPIEHPNVDRARAILNRILRRDLYTFCAQIKIGPNDIDCSVKSRKEMLNEIVKEDPEIEAENLVLKVVKFHYGMGHKNPIENFLFYSKDSPTTPYQMRPDDISAMLPKNFLDCHIQLYCKNRKDKDKAKKIFGLWCQKKEYKIKSKVRERSNVDELTPVKRKSDVTPYVSEKKKHLNF